MADPTKSWLLKPTIPAPPAVPNLASELYALADMGEPDLSLAESVDLYPSGTWRVGARAARAETTHDAERFATADSEAPTVRPGALRRR
jgi:hypothetical protein